MTDRLAPLPDIHDVVPFNEADEPIFAEIHAVLEKYNALQRFGITLLHQHLDIADGEILVEHIDAENRILTNRPMRAESVESAVETSWRLDDPVAKRRCETLCQKMRNAEGQEYHNQTHYTTS